MLSALRTLAVRTLLGPQKEREINWYLQAGNPEKLLSQLTPQLDKIAQIILHYATSVRVICLTVGLIIDSLCFSSLFLMIELLFLDACGYTRHASGFHCSYRMPKC